MGHDKTIMPKKILIIAAHADDEALGCGGTITRHSAKGDHVACIFMTNGVAARGNNEGADIRAKAAEKAAEILGIKKTYTQDFPDNKLDSVPLLEIVQTIEPIITKEQPEIIYTHFAHDLNIDHRTTYQAVLTACRPQKGSSVREIYSFEVPSSTEWQAEPFAPNMIVDISKHIDTKMAALKAYDIEMREAPHSRSYEAVKALASWRGQSHGFFYGEAFQAVRILK